MNVKAMFRRVMPLLLAVLLVTGGAAWAGAAKTLVVGFDAMNDSFDPAVFTSWMGINTINNVFDTLVQTKDGAKFEPGLATSWTISSDGLTYTFKLRQGVKFHDGTAFNAEAVKFSFERQLDPKHPYHAPGMTQAQLAFGSVARIEVLGPYEIRMVLKQPNAAQLANLCIFSTGIVSPDAVKKLGADFPVKPVGSGPFKFDRLDKGQQIVLSAFKEYWGGAPKVDRVIIKGIPEDSARKAALLSGEIDLTTYVDPKDIKGFKANKNLKVEQAVANSTGYMGMNQRHPALANQKVRQALSYGVNRQQIVDVIFEGQTKVAGGWLPPVLFAHDPSLQKAYPYDPEKAKKLLAEAGYPNGFEVTFDVQAAAHWPRLAELVQEDFRKIGVKATIRKGDASAMVAMVNAGKHGVFFMDWTGGNLDPDYFMISPFHSESPRAKGRLYYANKQYDTLVVDAQKTSDLAKRKQLYLAAQKILLEDPGMAFLYYNVFTAVMSKRVSGFELNPIRYLFFKDVVLE
ncbi:MAG: ABC transporter substrate-binding protein [Candidatus Methylomirabilota bacterium]